MHVLVENDGRKFSVLPSGSWWLIGSSRKTGPPSNLWIISYRWKWGAMFSMCWSLSWRTWLWKERSWGFEIWLVEFQLCSLLLGWLWCHNQDCLGLISLICKMGAQFHCRTVMNEGQKSSCMRGLNRCKPPHLSQGPENDAMLTPLPQENGQRPTVVH